MKQVKRKCHLPFHHLLRRALLVIRGTLAKRLTEAGARLRGRGALPLNLKDAFRDGQGRFLRDRHVVLPPNRELCLAHVVAGEGGWVNDRLLLDLSERVLH